MLTLLLVDDEELVKRGIKAFVDFKQLGIDRVFEASNGLEALALFKEHDIHLVLMDINMPKLNGLEAAMAMKTLQPKVKIAILTGYDYFDYAVSALKIGVEDYILKPVAQKDVTEVLSRMIKGYSKSLQTQEMDRIVETLVNRSATDSERGYKALLKEKVDSQMSNPAFSLTLLAEQMGFSAGYLSGLFKDHFGIPFQDYMLSTRLEKAKLLLLSTDMKNYEVAEAVGFEDVNYFGTRFKKQFGLSPKQYQQKVRSSDENV
jgi:two-component system response regulator YesN